MKLMRRSCSVLIIFPLLMFVVSPNHGTSQELLEPWFASEIEVVDSLDPQKVICLAYRFDDTIIYDSPMLLRLYPNQYYHLKFRFRLFTKDGQVDHSNYQKKKFRLEISPSDPESFDIRQIAPHADGISLYGTCLQQSERSGAFEIRLIDPNSQLAGNGNFKLTLPNRQTDDFIPSYLHETIDKYRLIYEETGMKNH